MEKQRLRAAGLVTAGVVAGGILTGTLGAQAANDSDERPTDAPGPMMAHHGAPGGMGGPDGPRGGDDLAKALGVSQDALRSAFDAIRDDVEPAHRRADGPPTKAQRAAMHEQVTDALAKELGLSEAKVEAAFEQVRSAHTADRREALSDRLDAAVEDGQLTKRDKASVLKAFDAGLLGGSKRLR